MDDAPHLSGQIDALLGFIPAIEAGGEGWTGEWKGGDRLPSGVIQMPWFDYSPLLLKFMSACYEHGWVVPGLTWVANDTLYAMKDDPTILEDVDLEMIRRLLTTHLRAERTNDGHVAGVAESGHLLAILRRLAVLRAAM